ncbi:hypothetical protein GCM10011579_068470 [Streptomyces albiflavescens]|uniref:Uncharacterized protein n=1 Tax=Streptomyces albiflavescens TaxID=1623582 RepID=A0A917YAS7_9ACTN|nr:hypothetical protein [Streptomyces albiflavescens]GGN81654.1 hypothetical protein GCM10011579_068470 [Streptomyces albiflavescens]
MTNRETTQATKTRPEPRRTPPTARPTAPGAGDATAAHPAADDSAAVRPVRGRHRRPRPRRVLFAVGGLALAAGVLSFVRMTPESVIGGGGSAEAEPTGATVMDTAGSAVTTVEAVPSGDPKADTGTAAMGASSATPTPGASGVPTPSPTTPASIPSPHGSAPATSAPDTTGIPTAPMTTPLTTPPPAATTPGAPQPTPSATTHGPAPQPDPPIVCVPIVGICVNGLAAPIGPR